MCSPSPSNFPPLSGAVFLDRDGVVNRDSRHYIKSWKEFSFIRGSRKAIRLLTENGHRVILITNQSMINRGIAPLADLENIFFNMRRKVENAGGRITDILYCPHRPDENCNCRKPKPGLIITAQHRHSIDLAKSVMIGDSATDIQCARNAGCGQAVLVKTGNGIKARKELAAMKIRPDLIADNLLEAVRALLASDRQP